jgi:hypothetical protein
MLRWFLGLALLFTVLFTSMWYEAALTADAPKSHPRQVLLIRHAEKPPDDAMSDQLTDAGKARADALPKLFAKTDARPEPFAKPDFVFAGANTKKSARSALTVAPLAKALNLKVNAKTEKEHFEVLARELLTNPKYSGKTILVCWNHSNLPGFAKALGAQGVPEHWKDEVFDRVWALTWDDTGKVTFNNYPQRLMPGDAKK